MNAYLESGIGAVMELCKLKEHLRDADWVITGEGSFDSQSLRGKVVCGVSKLAAQCGCRTAVIAGQVRIEPDEYKKHGIETAIACKQPHMDLDYAIANSATLLFDAAKKFANENL